MTEYDDNSIHIFTDADGIPEAAADVREMQQAGVELAAACALLGDDYDAVVDVITDRASQAGPGAVGVMVSAIATLAQLFSANIDLIEQGGLPIREHLTQIASGEAVDPSTLPRLSRAERRRKGRQL